MKVTNFGPTVTFFTALAVSAGALAGSAGSQEDLKKWGEIRKEAIPASELLSGKVRNIANPIGRIKHLILNEEKNDVQYVLFETPYPYSYYMNNEDGYLNYDSLDIDHSASGGTDLIISEDVNTTHPADKLKLTRGEVDDRMVSRLIGSDMEFKGGGKREVQDLLVHPNTGKVTHYIVEMDPDALFSENPKTIRAKNVTISEKGDIKTELSFEEVERKQDFDQAFL